MLSGEGAAVRVTLARPPPRQERAVSEEQLDPVRILVLDRGFVFVCRCPDPSGFALWLPVTHARIVRRWGTQRGLAQLVDGPLSETVLDAIVARELLPVRGILRVIAEVNEESWKTHLTLPSSGAATARPASSSSRTGSRSRAASAT
jgi:hypothetical protein